MADFGDPSTWEMNVDQFIDSGLPKEKPQELLDLQEQNRKQRLLQSLQKIGPRLEDSSLDFIRREEFNVGSKASSEYFKNRPIYKPTPVFKGNPGKLAGVKFKDKAQEKSYKDLLKQRYSVPKGSKQKVSNETFIKKFGISFDTMERVNRQLAKELNLKHPLQTYEGREKIIRERDKLRKENIKKTSSGAVESKIKRDIKKVDATALANDVDVAHRASLKANANLGAKYLVSSLGIDSKIVNQSLVKPTEQKLGKLYNDQQKLIKGLKPGKVPKDFQKKIEKLNIKISELSDRTKGALQGVLVDEKTLKPSIYGIDYKKVLGAGLIDKPVSELTQADRDIIKLNIDEQIKTAKKFKPGMQPDGQLKDFPGGNEKGFLGGSKAAKAFLKSLQLLGQPSIAAGFGIDELRKGNIKTAGSMLLAPEFVGSFAPAGKGILSTIGRVAANPFGKAVRAFTPVGLATIAGGAGYDVYKEIKRRQALTDEERLEEDIEAQAKDDEMMVGAAEGGRIGFADGPNDPSKRKFMKLMGILSLLPYGIGKMIKPAAKVAETAAPVVAEGVKLGFDNFMLLVNKIKKLGKKTDAVTQKEREVGYVYKGKDGNEYELVEDITTGDVRVTKDKPGFMSTADDTIETIEDRSTFVLRRNQADETTKGRKPPDEYDEMKEVPGPDGTFDDVDEISDLSVKEVLDEID